MRVLQCKRICIYYSFNSSDECYLSPGGTYTNLGNPLYVLSNSTGYRVWLHQYANGSGWADCFDHGQAYDTVGQDANPGNLYISTNIAACPSNSNTSETLCGSPSSFVLTLGPATDSCYQSIGATYNTNIPAINILINGTGYRVWLHQYSNSSGWADCFSNNNAYGVGGLRDANPGALQTTFNPNVC